MNSDEQGKITWDKTYNLSKSPNLWGEPAVPFVQTAIDLFNSSSCRNVMEIPCGDGRNTVPLASAFPYLVAADSSPNALQIVKQVLEFRSISTSLLMKADIFDMPFVDEQFDGIFCCDVLGHLTQPVVALNEMLRVLKPRGYMMVNVFAMGDSTRGPNMRSIGEEEYIYDEKFYFKFYDKEAVQQLLQQVDAEIVSLDLVRWAEPPHEGYREYPHEHESWLFVIQKVAR